MLLSRSVLRVSSCCRASWGFRLPRWSTCAWFPCALFGIACAEPLSEAECFDLLDRYTDKVVDQARPGASSAERSELQLQARQKALLDPEFSVCSAAVSRAEFECAMAANTADDIERCLL